jgi:hypothetical protein
MPDPLPFPSDMGEPDMIPVPLPPDIGTPPPVDMSLEGRAAPLVIEEAGAEAGAEA